MTLTSFPVFSQLMTKPLSTGSGYCLFFFPFISMSLGLRQCLAYNILVKEWLDNEWIPFFSGSMPLLILSLCLRYSFFLNSFHVDYLPQMLLLAHSLIWKESVLYCHGDELLSHGPCPFMLCFIGTVSFISMFPAVPDIMLYFR